MILSVAIESQFVVHKHCRYKPNDYYLKQLIEQWCEGVIQNGNQRKYNFSTRNRIDLGPESMILDKVAEHLQKDSANSISINLRGLSKVEARIVVLAVLRMIREKYTAGLEVISAASRIGNDRNQDGINHPDKHSNMEENAKRVILRANVHSPTRKPVVLQKMRITKESLQSWLIRRLDASVVQ
ncbi:hypothetical protein RDI58_021830 [Solanum bulbocastanum]|uniref:Uncharacterized protein n=1 Tax=Solanum bulbocastanum TaxID=147425 RepID=A0AAN8T9H0_SOLBU